MIMMGELESKVKMEQKQPRNSAKKEKVLFALETPYTGVKWYTEGESPLLRMFAELSG